VIINYPEVAVKEQIGEVLNNYSKKKPGICKCQRCQDDIMAIALNNLPAKYVVSEEGRIYTKTIYDQIGGKAQVIAAIISAIQVVAAKPRHTL